jgi:hypothetical protein
MLSKEDNPAFVEEVLSLYKEAKASSEDLALVNEFCLPMQNLLLWDQFELQDVFSGPISKEIPSPDLFELSCYLVRTPSGHFSNEISEMCVRVYMTELAFCESYLNATGKRPEDEIALASSRYDDLCKRANLGKLNKKEVKFIHSLPRMESFDKERAMQLYKEYHKKAFVSR